MKVFKSIKKLYTCKLISILVFLMAFFIYTNRVVADEYKNIIQDLPTATDFDDYLSALELALDFCVRNKHYVDLNMKYGLTLIDVNLGQLLQQQRTSIPENIRSRLEEIFVKNDEVSEYFQLMVQQHQHIPEIAQNMKLVQLFFNASSAWPRPPDKFNLNLLNKTNFYSAEQLENIYGKWRNYHANVDNYDEIEPSPAESDKCIALLALNEPIHVNGTSQIKCLTSYNCRRVMMGGNEFGYGLTHRKKDKSKTDVFCQKCFNEVNYIASNDFKLPDLMYGQITLCSLLGHAQFLRNSWIKSPLRLQTTEGCFSERITTEHFGDDQIKDDEDHIWKIVRPFAIMNGQCNGHFTAMAVGVLSSALRYIIETYY